MSTVDPAKAREERARAWREGPGSRSLLLGTAAMLALASFVLGFGIMVDVDSSRITSLNSVFADWDSNLDGFRWAFPVGIAGTILASMLMMFAANAATGRPLSFPVVGPLTIGLVGVAIGVSIAAPLLTEPLTVGVRTDPVFFEDEPWGGGEWFWYAVSWWGPLLAWTLAIASVVVAVVVRRRRGARRESLEQLLATGRIVRGLVTQAPIPSPESANLIGTITVRFEDAQGTPRWATTTGAWSVSTVPSTGDWVAVLFDPATPGDTRRIWIGPGGSRTAEDFTRWRLGA